MPAQAAHPSQPLAIAVRALRRRSARVVAMLVAIVAMSVGDLYMTLVHLTGAGMLESNPIARVVMAYNSSAILAAWKLTTVCLAVGILFMARRSRHGEIAAAFCCCVLTWLTVRWVSYTDEVAKISPEFVTLAATDDHRFVQIETDN